jgi:hypothetical protein
MISIKFVGKFLEPIPMPHEFNVARYHSRMRAAAERLPGSGTTSSAGSADEFARMVGTSNRGSLPLGFQGTVVPHCMAVFIRWQDFRQTRLSLVCGEKSLSLEQIDIRRRQTRRS